ncbi:MAG TPA: ABC transporter substrate-binding protein [Spirochaetia bacterium]|nr:ABC transporter substrate-binding protein [Spirochaetia bacterium]
MVKKTSILFLIIMLLSAAVVFGGGKAEEKPSGGKVTLTMLDLNPEGSPFISALNKSFMEKNPNIVIEYEAMNSRQYDQRIQALAAAGDLPDICTTQMFPQYKQMAANDLFMDLTNTNIVKSGIFDDIAATCLVKNGKVYGVTWNHLAVGAFYNVDIFKKYNLNIPTNWDEFLNVCETLKKNGVTPIVSDLGDGWCTMYIINNAAGNLIYAKNPKYDQELLAGKRKMTDPVWQEIFEKIKYIYDKGYYGENPMGGKYEQSLSDFANGKGAMHIIGTWVIPVFDQLNPSLNYSMFPVPFNKKGEDTYITLEGELGMSIAANSKHKEEALKYFEYFFSEEPYKAYLTGKKGFSAVKGINVSFHPSVAYIVDNYLSKGKTTPYFSREWPAGMDALLFKVFQEVMMGTKTIPVALDELEKYLRANVK